jgi:pyruvate dehydrogenase E2 component (dihydrolipoamide acetyltransferase)
MSIFRRNVELGRPLKISSSRKVSLGTWRTVGDPSVYGIVAFDVDKAVNYIERLRKETGIRVTLSHFVGKAIAQMIHKHPQINCLLRFGKLYPRKNIDIFFQVASDDQGEDLSGMTVRNADQKSLLDIAREMEDRVKAIKSKKDKSFTRSKNTVSLFPGLLVRRIVDFMSFILYTLNIWTPLLGTPRDPFGSAMITNIGSIGLETAFAPLVPYSRVPILFALSSARDEAVVRDGQIRIVKQMKICVTFDHRVIDGMHAANMTKTLRALFEEPERLLAAGSGNSGQKQAQAQ